MRLTPQQLSITPNKFVDILKQAWQNLFGVLNGNVSFGDGTNADNINGVWANANSVIGNFTITHNLGRVPVGYLIVKSTAFEIVKFISSTTTQLTLAGQNGGSALTLFIF